MSQSQFTYEVDKRTFSVSQADVTLPLIINQQESPSARCFHTSCIYERNMYIFGGSEEGRKVISINDNFYKLDLDTYKWDKMKVELHPSLARECHSATIVNNYMYIFGGINSQTLFDDLWCFNFNNDTWKKIDVKAKPKARHSTTLINYQSRYLFLFGGIDADNIVCSSSFLFDLTENKWCQLNDLGQDCYRCYPALTTSDRFFIFGGGKNVLLNGNLEKKLCQLILDTNHLQLRSLPVLPSKQNTMIPPGMIHHTIMQLGNNLLLIFGGMFQIKQQGINMNNWLYVYKRQTSVWQAIQLPKLQPKAKFSISRKDNMIYIFGGMKSHSEICNDLVVITFPEINDQSAPIPRIMNRSELPVNNSFSHKDQKDLEVQNALVSMSFIGSIASMQRHPFTAIAHIIDCANMFKATQIRFSQTLKEGTTNQPLYFRFSFDGKRILSNNDFSNIIYSTIQKPVENSSSMKQLTCFGTKLKLGTLRLGKTVLFVQRCKQFRNVVLFSIDSHVVPNCDLNMIMFFYVENISTGQILNYQGKTFKQYIVNFLKGQGDSLQVIQSTVLQGTVSSSDIYIFETNRFPTNENTFESELNFTTNNDAKNDVYPLINVKKIEFLDNIGYEISSQPDVSLRSYFKVLYLQPKCQIFIGNDKQPVPVIDYRFVLSTLNNKQYISRIEPTTKLDAVRFMEMYAISNQETFVPHNLGLLIYAEGRLIKRYRTNFGQIFQKKFFKNKYKTSRFNVHKQLGIIDIETSFLKLDLLETDFEYNRLSMTTWTNIKLNIKTGQAKFKPLNQKRSMLLGKSLSQ